MERSGEPLETAADIAPMPRTAAPAGDAGDAGPDEEGRALRVYAGFRATLLFEIDAMSRHLLSEGRPIDELTTAILQHLENGERPSIEELMAAHGNLAESVAPATPRAICALREGQRAGGISRLLGPTPAVRRLAAANLMFALLFFGLSITPTINQDTISLSIYDQSGAHLLIKLLFIMSAAGLGASFGALFEVWNEISEGRFDPITESAHWMRIALGLVAGLVLSEIVGTETTRGAEPGSGTMMTAPLLALAGGFSARLVHLVVTRIVSAIEHTFEPSAARHQGARGRGARPAAAGGAGRKANSREAAAKAREEPGKGAGEGAGETPPRG